MECDICLKKWNTSERIPRILQCGHTFCEECLLEIYKKVTEKGTEFLCPTCKKLQDIKSEGDITNLVKNFNLILIAENYDLNNGDSSDSMSETERNNIKILNSSKKTSGFDINNLCFKHKMPIHSSIPGTNFNVCQKCIEEESLNAIPIPGAIDKIQRIIDFTQLKIFFSKNQLCFIKKYLKAYLNNLEKTSKTKIDDFFAYYIKIINHIKDSTLEKFENTLKDEKQYIQNNMEEITKLYEDLNVMESELSILTNSDNSIILKNLEKIRKFQKRMTNYINYDLELSLHKFDININEEYKENLIEALENTFTIDYENIEDNYKSPTIGTILSIDNNWTCICGKLKNPKSDIKCGYCNSLKRLEIYSIDLPCCNNIKEGNESEDFNIRIKEEKKQYNKIIEKEKNSVNDEYYLINKEWYNNWSSIINNKINIKNYDDNCGVIINDEIGIISPGPISNWKLCEFINNKITLKNNLKKDNDYIIISKNLWKFFLINYNGGPNIKINKKNPKLDSIDLNSIIFENKIFSYSQIKDKYFPFSRFYLLNEGEEEIYNTEETIENDT